MRRVCKRKVQIDALTACYEVRNPYLYEELSNLEYGERYDVCEFWVVCTKARYFNHAFTIWLNNGKNDIVFGTLKYDIAGGNETSNKFPNGMRKVWISLDNAALYGDDIHNIFYVEQMLGLNFHNTTCIDLCLDTPFSIAHLIKSYIHNCDITTILNGKRIKDRNADRPEITYTYSGSLNNQNKYLTVNIKQKDAIKDKTKGVTVTIYDKKTEVANSSGKQYVLDYYGNPKSLYRTEVHLNNEDVNAYMKRTGTDNNPLLYVNDEVIEDMFFYFLGSVIRFQSKSTDVSWRHILGRS